MGEILYKDNGVMRMCTCQENGTPRDEVIRCQGACEYFREWSKSGLCYWYRHPTQHCSWTKEQEDNIKLKSVATRK